MKLKNPLQPKAGDTWHAEDFGPGVEPERGKGFSHLVTFGEEIEPLPDGTRQRKVKSNKLGEGIVTEEGKSWWQKLIGS